MVVTTEMTSIALSDNLNLSRSSLELCLNVMTSQVHWLFVVKSSVIGWLCYIALRLWRRTPFEPLPVIGHLHAFAFSSRVNRHRWLLEASQHFQGRSFPLWVPLLGKGWFIEDPACLKHILKTEHESFSKGEFFTSKAKALFGDGILLTNGESWHTQRAAGQVFVSAANLADIVQKTLPKHLALLLDPLDRAAETKQTLNLMLISLDFTMAVFGDLAYDIDYKQLAAEFGGPFDRSTEGVDHRFVNPAWRPMEAVLPFGRRLRADLAAVHRFGRELVRETFKAISEEEEGLRDVVEGRGLFVRELRALAPGWDERQVSDACLNFFSAGRDTTGQTIGWAFYRLMMNPEWLPGILEEIDHLGRSPTYSDLIPPTTTLPRLIAFISEVLRLHPALPLEILESTAEEPIILPDGAIVQPQDKVIWSPWVMARSPNIWGPDADVFDPDRFMDSDPRSAAANKKTAFEWPVFHAGPRSCLGKNLARAEIAYALFEILGRYEIHMAWDGSPREVGGGLTSHMQGGLPVRVTRRDG